MNDSILQGVDIQLKTLQALLSLVTNFPTIHSRILPNVRAFVLCSLVLDGWTDPASVFQAT